MSFMYWYHAQGGSLPVATRPSAHFRNIANDLSIRLFMTQRFKFHASGSSTKKQRVAFADAVCAGS
jgi:hypothetical protein